MARYATESISDGKTSTPRCGTTNGITPVVTTETASSDGATAMAWDAAKTLSDGDASDALWSSTWSNTYGGA